MKSTTYLLLVLVCKVSYSIAAGLWSCYNYTSSDRSQMRYHGEEFICNRRGRVFTARKNDYYPGCGDCWCCKRTDPWKCYNYSNTDRKDIALKGEKRVCEGAGGVFNRRRNHRYRGCGCRCCQRMVTEKCLACESMFTGRNVLDCFNEYCQDPIGGFGAANTMTADMLCAVCRRLPDITKRLSCTGMFCSA